MPPFSLPSIANNDWCFGYRPITYRDIPVDTVAAITVWDVVGPRKVTAIGGESSCGMHCSTLWMFSEQGHERSTNDISCASSPRTGTTVSLFGKKMELRKGMKKLQLWPSLEADGRWDGNTPCKIQASSGKQPHCHHAALLPVHVAHPCWHE